jgi:hypothetical protein
VLEEYSSRLKPTVFSLIGGTFGNLNRAGAPFLNNLLQIMLPGDALLLDLPLAGPAWSAAADPRMDKAAYTEPFRRFLANGVARRDSKAALAGDPSWFDRRIQCISEASPAVAGAQRIRIVDVPTAQVLLQFHRYDWDAFRAWVQDNGYVILYQQATPLSAGDSFGMGVLLLGRAR